MRAKVGALLSCLHGLYRFAMELISRTLNAWPEILQTLLGVCSILILRPIDLCSKDALLRERSIKHVLKPMLAG